jgi:ribonuclease I
MIFSLLVLSASAYDFNLLEVSWKPSECEDIKCAPDYNFNDFNIKQFSEESKHGPGPGFCSRIPFAISNQTIFMLMSAWQSPDGKHLKTWEHEWKKHGTCFEPMLSPDDYFLLALETFQSLEIFDTLVKNEIFPHSEKKYQVDKLMKAFGKRIMVHCLLKPNGIYFLRDLAFCFDFEMKLTDCPEIRMEFDEFNFPVYWPPDL